LIQVKPAGRHRSTMHPDVFLEHFIMNQITKDLHAIIDDAEQMLQHVGRGVGGEVEAARERLEKSVHSAKTRLQATRDAVGEGVHDAIDGTDSYVHGNPWTAIGIGAGVGLLIGYLLGARR
jgi:ElaB/YqjD/DUF883 family membrane-anchored ribosome-binding protein